MYRWFMIYFDLHFPMLHSMTKTNTIEHRYGTWPMLRWSLTHHWPIKNGAHHHTTSKTTTGFPCRGRQLKSSESLQRIRGSAPVAQDIEELLNRPPIESPFALAMQRASHVLVIPNDTVSIYTRSPCWSVGRVGCVPFFWVKETAKDTYTWKTVCVFLNCSDCVSFDICICSFNERYNLTHWSRMSLMLGVADTEFHGLLQVYAM